MVIKQTTAPTGYDDIALADAALTEVGVPVTDRLYFASPRVANLMAGDLRQAADVQRRSPERLRTGANIGIDIAGFDVFKNDQTIRLGPASGGAAPFQARTSFGCRKPLPPPPAKFPTSTIAAKT